MTVQYDISTWWIHYGNVHDLYCVYIQPTCKYKTSTSQFTLHDSLPRMHNIRCRIINWIIKLKRSIRIYCNDLVTTKVFIALITLVPQNPYHNGPRSAETGFRINGMGRPAAWTEVIINKCSPTESRNWAISWHEDYPLQKVCKSSALQGFLGWRCVTVSLFQRDHS